MQVPGYQLVTRRDSSPPISGVPYRFGQLIRDFGRLLGMDITLMHRSLAVLTWALSLGAFRELPAQVADVPMQPLSLRIAALRAAVIPTLQFLGASASLLVGPLILSPMAAVISPLRSRSFSSYGASIELSQLKQQSPISSDEQAAA